jgi:hypothetical protein
MNLQAAQYTAALGLMILAACTYDTKTSSVSSGDGRVCLANSSIQDTTVVDQQTILFRMNNGTVWRNRLNAVCPGLDTQDGFAYAVSGDNRICDNMQTIHVNLTGAVCQLGKFERVEGSGYSSYPWRPARTADGS